MNDAARLIGVDWGTSNLRVMRIGEGGAVLATRSDPRGAGALAPDAFPRVLDEVAGNWITEGLPVLVCGMAGARGRWRETPYLPCPAGLRDVAAGVVSVRQAGDIGLTPGVAAYEDNRLRDVMRGEEVQVFGLDGPDTAVIVAPGTHSKWIVKRNGAVAGFRTFMTGELFAALRQSTILGAGMGEPGADDDAFAAGVAVALRDPALTHTLFSVRVDGLAGRLPPASAADYLSGLLIGAEIASQTDLEDRVLILVGAEALCRRYAAALLQAGLADIRIEDAAVATARGLWRIQEVRTP